MIGAEAIVRLGIFDAGLRGYVAIRGGTDVAEVLGSRPYDALGKLDPTPLQVGQVLQIGGPEYSTGSSIAIYSAPHWSSETVRLDVVPDPGADWFTSKNVNDFFHKTWTATQETNRVGLRLSGTTLERRVTYELASEGIVPSMIQVPASGQPITFGPDHPVMGGCPAIGMLTEPSLSRVGQLVPGMKVQFRRVWAAQVRGIILRDGAPLRLPAVSVTQFFVVKSATTIEYASFSDLSVTDAYAISALRTDVFYPKQSYAGPEMDQHDLENIAEHYFIRDANDSRKIIAYLCMIDMLDEFSSSCPCTIGHVTVDAAARGTELSLQLLRQVIAGYPGTGLALHAQTQAKGVYVKVGFRGVGEIFMEADIEHITMVCDAA